MCMMVGGGVWGGGVERKEGVNWGLGVGMDVHVRVETYFFTQFKSFPVANALG